MCPWLSPRVKSELTYFVVFLHPNSYSQTGREGGATLHWFSLARAFARADSAKLEPGYGSEHPQTVCLFHLFFRLTELVPILPAGWIIANSTGWLNLCQFYRLGFFWPPFRIREKVVEISRAAQLVVRLISTTFSGLTKLAHVTCNQSVTNPISCKLGHQPFLILFSNFVTKNNPLRINMIWCLLTHRCVFEFFLAEKVSHFR